MSLFVWWLGLVRIVPRQADGWSVPNDVQPACSRLRSRQTGNSIAGSSAGPSPGDSIGGSSAGYLAGGRLVARQVRAPFRECLPPDGAGNPCLRLQTAICHAPGRLRAARCPLHRGRDPWMAGWPLPVWRVGYTALHFPDQCEVSSHQHSRPPHARRYLSTRWPSRINLDPTQCFAAWSG